LLVTVELALADSELTAAQVATAAKAAQAAL
jgi:hypothetical protein